jgi:hypothetical protein
MLVVHLTCGQLLTFYPALSVSTGIYTHHILTNGMGSQPGFIGSGSKGFAGAGGAGFVGAGNDNGNRPWVYAPKDQSAGSESGYQRSLSTRFSAQIVLVNYNNSPRLCTSLMTLSTFPYTSDCNPKPWRGEAGDSMTMIAQYDLKSHPL